MIKSFFTGCRLVCGLVFCLLGCLAVRSGASGKNSASLQTFVSVPLRQSVTVLSKQSSVVVTDAALRRGYVDIPDAIRILICNNDKSGSLILVQGVHWPFKRLLISGMGRDIDVNTPEAFIEYPYTKNEIPRVLHCRLYLTEDARTGEFPWLLSFSIQKL